MNKIQTVKYSDGISVDYDLTTNTAVVWSPDGDYDAHYNADDKTGIENELAFIRSQYADKRVYRGRTIQVEVATPEQLKAENCGATYGGWAIVDGKKQEGLIFDCTEGLTESEVLEALFASVEWLIDFEISSLKAGA